VHASILKTGILMHSFGEIFDRPSKWLLLSSVADITVVSVLATRGILMEAIRPQLVFTILIACVCYLAVIDRVKVTLLRRLPTGL
jgi:H+-transporting ATPase